jgi:hypothetical protein
VNYDSNRVVILAAALSTTDRYMHELAGPKREAVQKIEKLILFPHKKASGE